MYIDDRSYIEILDLDVNKSENFDICYTYLINTLERWYKNEFKDDTHIILRALTDQYLLCCQTVIEKSILYSEAQKGIEQLVTHIFSKGNENTHVVRYHYLVSRLFQIRVLVNKERNNLLEIEESPIPELVKIQLADKTQAGKLINDAINIIRDCDGLKSATKRSIIKFLTDALFELNSDKPNYTIFFGKTSFVLYSLIMLGTSVLSGTDSYMSLKGLKSANDKIQSANNLVIESSTDLSRLGAINTLDIGNDFRISNNQICLPEVIDKQ